MFTCRDCTENFFYFQVYFPMRSMFLFDKIWLVVMAILKTILKIILFICFDCAGSSLLHVDFLLVAGSRGYSLVHRLLTVVASLMEHGL